jgi:hypothetical protein
MPALALRKPSSKLSQVYMMMADQEFYKRVRHIKNCTHNFFEGKLYTQLDKFYLAIH